jgi:hypothetical protein
MTTTTRTAMASQLREDVLACLAARPGEWVPGTDLLTLAPQGRTTVNTELGDTPFGFDDPRGPVYDAGPSGKPDGSMLADVMHELRKDLAVEERVPLAYRLYDPEERIGLGEISGRLGVKRDTVDHWRVRGVLPETSETCGRRPRWPWRVVREWAIATGRDPRGPNSPRWNGRNGAGSGTVVDAATSEPYAQSR